MSSIRAASAKFICRLNMQMLRLRHFLRLRVMNGGACFVRPEPVLSGQARLMARPALAAVTHRVHHIVRGLAIVQAMPIQAELSKSIKAERPHMRPTHQKHMAI